MLLRQQGLARRLVDPSSVAAAATARHWLPDPLADFAAQPLRPERCFADVAAASQPESVAEAPPQAATSQSTPARPSAPLRSSLCCKRLHVLAASGCTLLPLALSLIRQKVGLARQLFPSTAYSGPGVCRSMIPYDLSRLPAAGSLHKSQSAGGLHHSCREYFAGWWNQRTVSGAKEAYQAFIRDIKEHKNVSACSLIVCRRRATCLAPGRAALSAVICGLHAYAPAHPLQPASTRHCALMLGLRAGLCPHWLL